MRNYEKMLGATLFVKVGKEYKSLTLMLNRYHLYLLDCTDGTADSFDYWLKRQA